MRRMSLKYLTNEPELSAVNISLPDVKFLCGRPIGATPELKVKVCDEWSVVFSRRSIVVFPLQVPIFLSAARGRWRRICHERGVLLSVLVMVALNYLDKDP